MQTRSATAMDSFPDHRELFAGCRPLPLCCPAHKNPGLKWISESPILCSLQILLGRLWELPSLRCV